MPRQPSDYVPSLRKHPSRDIARVTLGGRDFNCGRPGGHDTQVRYHELISDWIRQGRPRDRFIPSWEVDADHSMTRLVVKFARHLKQRWPDKQNRTVHREFASWRPILKLVRRNYGEVQLSPFGPKVVMLKPDRRRTSNRAGRTTCDA